MLRDLESDRIFFVLSDSKQDRRESIPSYLQLLRRSASSASAPRRWSQTTGPASHPAPASCSRSSLPASTQSEKKRAGLLHASHATLRPRGHRRGSWSAAHVWEPSVERFIPGWGTSTGAAVVNGIWSTCLRLRKVGLRSPWARAGGSEGPRRKSRVFGRLLQGFGVTDPARARCGFDLKSLLRPRGAVHLCWKKRQTEATKPEEGYCCFKIKASIFLALKIQ